MGRYWTRPLWVLPLALLAAGLSCAEDPVVRLRTGTVSLTRLGPPDTTGSGSSAGAGASAGVSVSSFASSDGKSAGTRSAAVPQDGASMQQEQQQDAAYASPEWGAAPSLQQYLLPHGSGEEQAQRHALLTAKGCLIVSYIDGGIWHVACPPAVARQLSDDGVPMALYTPQLRTAPEWGTILEQQQQAAARRRRRQLRQQRQDTGAGSQQQLLEDERRWLSEEAANADPGAGGGSGFEPGLADVQGSLRGAGATGGDPSLQRYLILVELLPGLSSGALAAAARDWPKPLAAAPGLVSGGEGGACWPVVEAPGAGGGSDAAAAGAAAAQENEAGGGGLAPIAYIVVHVCDQHLPGAVAWLSAQPVAKFVAPQLRVRATNAIAGEALQSGTLVAGVDPLAPAQRPYWTAGLTGSEEIVGIGDSGLDMTSCYFADPRYPGDLSNLVTGSGWPRRWYLPDHRKVLQYVLALGAEYGDEQAHGTHTSGSVAGARLSDPFNAASPYQTDAATGASPSAKLSFVDCGFYSDQGGGPPTPTIFPPIPYDTQYLPLHTAAGATIITDSWGSDSNVYNSQARTYDAFLWRNPGVASFLAAGNNGTTQNVPGGTISTPASAKNSITIGATYNVPEGAVTTNLYRVTGTDAAGNVNYNTGLWFSESLDSPTLLSRLGQGVGMQMVMAQPYYGCQPLTNTAQVAGKVVLVQRGGCFFWEKAANVQNAGGAALLIINNQPGDLVPSLAASNNASPGTSIPVAAVTQAAGEALAAQLSTGASSLVTLTITPTPVGLGDVAPFSSYGPTADGRIKPDLVAPGVGVVSAARAGAGTDAGGGGQCSGRVMQLSGTSMASPISAGHASLARQYLRTGYYPTGRPGDPGSTPFMPSGMLLKALLIAGAVSLQGGQAMSAGGTRMGPPPDGWQGWGRISLEGCLPLPGVTPPKLRLQVADGGVLSVQGEAAALTGLRVRADGADGLPLAVVLTWYDFPGDLNSPVALTNDLDLTVQVGGVTFLGNVKAEDTLAGLVQQPDTRNTVERVYLPSGLLTPGADITITVTASRLSSIWLSGNDARQPQRFAVAVTGPVDGFIQSSLNPAWSTASTLQSQQLAPSPPPPPAVSPPTDPSPPPPPSPLPPPPPPDESPAPLAAPAGKRGKKKNGSAKAKASPPPPPSKKRKRPARTRHML